MNTELEQAREQFTHGTRRMLAGIGPALWPPGEWGERFARWLLLGIVGTIAVLVMRVYPWLIAIVPVAWLIGAGAQGQAADEPDDDEDDDEDDEDEPATMDRDELLALLWEQIGDARGVHLKTLREALPGWSSAEVRELLADAGIRVRPGVRLPTGNVEGVHRADVPPLSPAPEAPSGDVVVAGESNNNNDNSGVVVDTSQGATIIYDPAETRRYTVDDARPRKGVNRR